MSLPHEGWWGVLAFSVALFAQPLYILVSVLVLRVAGNPKDKVAKWALRQADKNRARDLIKAWRDSSGKSGDPSSPGSAPPLTSAPPPQREVEPPPGAS
jgi:hypothetical protein